MSDPERIPLSILAPLDPENTIAVSISKKWVETPSSKGNAYWILVLDRSSLEVEYNVMWTKPDTAPPIPSSLDDPQYMLIVLTYGVMTAYVPSGGFYDFLVDNGAGAGLQAIVQASTQIGCGAFSALGYILVGQLGEGRPSGYVGIEASLVIGGRGLFLPLELIPVVINNKTVYTPSRLSG